MSVHESTSQVAVDSENKDSIHLIISINSTTVKILAIDIFRKNLNRFI